MFLCDNLVPADVDGNGSIDIDELLLLFRSHVGSTFLYLTNILSL